jgi:hypothetical protein
VVLGWHGRAVLENGPGSGSRGLCLSLVVGAQASGILAECAACVPRLWRQVENGLLEVLEDHPALLLDGDDGPTAALDGKLLLVLCLCEHGLEEVPHIVDILEKEVELVAMIHPPREPVAEEERIPDTALASFKDGLHGCLVAENRRSDVDD